jgi:hypothetical protein
MEFECQRCALTTTSVSCDACWKARDERGILPLAHASHGGVATVGRLDGPVFTTNDVGRVFTYRPARDAVPPLIQMGIDEVGRRKDFVLMDSSRDQNAARYSSLANQTGWGPSLFRARLKIVNPMDIVYEKDGDQHTVKHPRLRMCTEAELDEWTMNDYDEDDAPMDAVAEAAAEAAAPEATAASTKTLTLYPRKRYDTTKPWPELVVYDAHRDVVALSAKLVKRWSWTKNVPPSILGVTYTSMRQAVLAYIHANGSNWASVNGFKELVMQPSASAMTLDEARKQGVIAQFMA